jgi:hypothetical protein
MEKTAKTHQWEPPCEYTEEVIIDGEKVTVKVEEFSSFDKDATRCVRKKRKVTLFGREFEISLGEVIDPMIVRYTGESDPACFTNGQEYKVLSYYPYPPYEYRIVDNTNEDYCYLLDNFEIVRKGE